VNEIVLVDGVGRPKIIDAGTDDYPQTIGHARAHVRSGPNRIASFECTGEVDQDGRIIYRQAGTRARIRTEYLPISTIEVEPFNGPRVNE
jgi:hypothetical protein